MGKRKSLSHLVPKLIERDGGEYVCHYCGCNLIPPGTPENTEPYYEYHLQEVQPLVSYGVFNGKPDEDWEAKWSAYCAGNLRSWIGYWATSKAFSFPFVDHIVPLSKGGTHDTSNLVVACRECNQAKLTKDYEAFLVEVRHAK